MEENINAIFYISSVNSICAYGKNMNIYCDFSFSNELTIISFEFWHIYRKALTSTNLINSRKNKLKKKQKKQKNKTRTTSQETIQFSLDHLNKWTDRF